MIDDRFRFRAWSISKRIMRDVIDYWVHDDRICHTATRNIDGSVDTWFENFEMMQCTGQTDEFGMFIFEGDIVCIGDENTRYIIEWDNAEFICNPLKTGEMLGLYAWKHTFKIIGNIWENPELLESEEFNP